MNPEEIEVLMNAFSELVKTEESSNGPIYVLISLIVTISPFVFRYFKKTFVRSIEKVMYLHVKQVEDLHTIMHMHIDELVHIKEEQGKLKESHTKLDKKVVENSTWIETLKEKCA